VASLSGIYTFEAGAPRNDVYRLDFITSNKDYQNYLRLFQDAGWVHLGSMGGWQYFRKTRQGNEAPEIYTDSRVESAKVSPVAQSPGGILPYLHCPSHHSPSDATHLIYQIGKLLGGALVILFVIAIIKIYLRINQLKRM